MTTLLSSRFPSASLRSPRGGASRAHHSSDVVARLSRRRSKKPAASFAAQSALLAATVSAEGVDVSTRLHEWAAPRLEAVENALHNALPASQGPASRLHAAMRYAALGGGKRLRPLLCLAAAEICGLPARTVLPTACAIEMIHCFSLVHDDLPCMDNDALRRGRPTCHVAFGEAVAVLGGDSLLVEAFAQIAAQHQYSPAPRVLQTLRLLTQAAGANGMAGGQVADMQAESGTWNAETLAFIHTHKTGDMIRVSLAAGATLAGASSHIQAHLEAYGDALGHLFQVVDDILNACGDADKLGKAVGSDSARGKATYPALLGLEGARAEARRLAQTALQALEVFGPEAEPLRWMVTWALERDR